jgi:hypothetical protein
MSFLELVIVPDEVLLVSHPVDDGNWLFWRQCYCGKWEKCFWE